MVYISLIFPQRKSFIKAPLFQLMTSSRFAFNEISKRLGPMSVVSVSKNPLFINSAVIFSIFKHENDDSSAPTLLTYKFSSQNHMFCSVLRLFWIYLFQLDSLIYAFLITFFMILCFNKCRFIYWFDTFIENDISTPPTT